MNARTVAIARDSLLQHLRTAVLLSIVLTVLLGIIYPLIMTGPARCFFQIRRMAAWFETARAT